MSQIGPRRKKICSGQAISDGQTDRLITIGCPQSGALIKININTDAGLQQLI